MWALVLLGALLLPGHGLGHSPHTPSDYDDEMGQDTGGGGTLEAPAQPRSFPGHLCLNQSHGLALSNRSLELLLGWVPTRLVPAIYGLVLVVGLPANGLALWVLATRVPRLPSTMLLMNLAAADLLLALALPPRLAYHLRGQRWPFGEAACRLATATLYGHMYGSLLLLAAVSLDRYLALVHPLRARALRGQRLATGLCIAAWLAAAALVSPLLLQRQTYRLQASERVLCHDALPQDAQLAYWRPAFTCLALLGCCLPLAAMLLCYGATLRALAAAGQRYGHALRLTALVLASAVAFFAPSNTLLLLHYSDPRPGAWGDLYGAYVPSLAVSALNSCVDPFVYYYVSAEFRDKVREGLLRRPPRSAAASKASGDGAGRGSGGATRSSSLL